MSGSCDAGSAPGCSAGSGGSACAHSTAAASSSKLSSDLLSPFGSSLVQQQVGTPQAAPASPPEPSRSNSPLRVVGFDSSPTSVVALRRWQSAANPGTAAALEVAAAMEAAAVAEAGGCGPAGKPRSFPPAQRQSSMGRQSSLGAALKQQEQIAQLQKRLSVHTGRVPLGGSGRRRGQHAAHGAHAAASHPPLRGGGAPAPAAIAEDLEQDWLAALTPGTSELQEAAAADAAAAGGPFVAAAAGPFAAKAHVSFAMAGQAEHGATHGTLPAGGGAALHRAACALPLHDAAGLQRRAGGVLGGGQRCAVTRAGSASIDINYSKMRRAETAPALTDEIIAAAAAAACGSSATSSKHSGTPRAAAGPPSSGGSSYRGSPPGLARAPLPPQRLPSFTRELFDAQAEAVAAQTQARVLQQALAQVCWGGDVAWGAASLGCACVSGLCKQCHASGDLCKLRKTHPHNPARPPTLPNPARPRSKSALRSCRPSCTP